MHILAHGGWFVMPEEKHAPTALNRALQAGFGIAVPVRDHNGIVVIAEGPATEESFPISEFLVERPVWPGRTPFMALQIESSGLHRLIRRELASIERLVPYVVGMTVTDMPHYLDGAIPVFVRQSEVEPTPAYYELAEGVWLDGLERQWYDERVILSHLKAGKLVTVVSEDHHLRPHREQWQALKELLGQLGELGGRLQLCTERPAEAHDFFGD